MTTTTSTGDSDASVLIAPLAPRLTTIVEAKGDTTPSENDEEAPKRPNGAHKSRIVNYMMVLLL
jgi:hypothetical protein